MKLFKDSLEEKGSQKIGELEKKLREYKERLNKYKENEAARGQNFSLMEAAQQEIQRADDLVPQKFISSNSKARQVNISAVNHTEIV